jgi:hypothetical protein
MNKPSAIAGTVAPGFEIADFSSPPWKSGARGSSGRPERFINTHFHLPRQGMNNGDLMED